ncbi:MAG: hypothetical protein ACOX8E_07970 [Ruminococcus sp.]
MTSQIINVILIVICMMAAGKCYQKSALAFMQRGKIPMNIYALAQEKKKKDLSKMNEEERKRAYQTAGFVFLGFGLALTFLLIGFVMEISGRNGEICFTLAIGVEIVEFILIAWAIKRK